MSDQIELVRMEVAFWAFLILSCVVQGVWWQAAYTVLALASLPAIWRKERQIRGIPPRPGFWSRVWSR